MSPSVILELVLMALRYLAPLIVGVIAHYVTEKDQSRLIEILTSKEFAATLVTTCGAFYLAFRSWRTAKKTALAAAASPGPVTMQEAADLAKTQAPKLSTPATEIPQLTPKKE